MEGVFLDEGRIARERARGVWPGQVATDYLDRWVAEKPDATALVAWRLEEESETRLTYRSLAARVAGAAAALERAGVREGDVVSIQLPNWWEFVVLYLAAVRLFQESAVEANKMFKDGKEDHLLAAYPKSQEGSDKIREVGGKFWPNEFPPN